MVRPEGVQPGAHLLRLPAEIRSQIYGELLHTSKTKVFFDKGSSLGHSGYE